VATNLSLAFTTFVDFPGTPDTPAASDFNRLQINDSFFANRPGIVARRLNPASIAHGTEVGIGFEVDDLDSENTHDPAGFSQEFRIAMAGWYDIRAGVMWDAPSGGATPQGYRSLRIRRKPSGQTEGLIAGGRVEQAAVPTPNIGTGQQIVPPLTRMFVGDIVRVAVVHTQGATLTVGDAFFSLLWVRQP
jgi:hypothetical protein